MLDLDLIKDVVEVEQCALANLIKGTNMNVFLHIILVVKVELK